jgi:molybdopterin synthase sulfur carrier subunit
VPVATITLRLFASAREAAATSQVALVASTVGDALAQARDRFGEPFAAVLASSRVWLDGEEPAAGDATVLGEGSELAVLPPVSGGAVSGGAVRGGAAAG